MALEVFVGIFFDELDGTRKIVDGPRSYWVFRSGSQFIKADPTGEKSTRPAYTKKPQEGALYRVSHRKPNRSGFCEIWQIDPITVPATKTY